MPSVTSVTSVSVDGRLTIVEVHMNSSVDNKVHSILEQELSGLRKKFEYVRIGDKFELILRPAIHDELMIPSNMCRKVIKRMRYQHKRKTFWKKVVIHKRKTTGYLIKNLDLNGLRSVRYYQNVLDLIQQCLINDESPNNFYINIVYVTKKIRIGYEVLIHDPVSVVDFQ